MQNSLKADLQKLGKMAYHRLDYCGDYVRELHHLRKSARQHPDFDLLEKICAWLFVPFTLWPIDLERVCAITQQRMGAGERLENELRLLIASLSLPNDTAQEVASAHEREVQRGSYDGQVRVSDKYQLNEEKLLKDPRFREEWAAIQSLFDLTQYRDDHGIIRRSMVAERGFRPDGWHIQWDEPNSRFQALFDVFCHRWDLYGMAGDQPLLMKLTINLTPHGTMIFVPSWWSLDHTRDLNWAEMKKLHNARVSSKQGAKLTRNQMEQAAEAKKAARLDAEARASGLKGERRETWVMEQLKWAVKDPRKLRRTLNRAKRMGEPSPGSISFRPSKTGSPVTSSIPPASA